MNWENWNGYVKVRILIIYHRETDKRKRDTNINIILIVKSKQELQMASFELLKFILGVKCEKNKTNKIASQFRDK